MKLLLRALHWGAVEPTTSSPAVWPSSPAPPLSTQLETRFSKARFKVRRDCSSLRAGGAPASAISFSCLAARVALVRKQPCWLMTLLMRRTLRQQP